MTHITWNIEKNDRCPHCGGETLLVLALGKWRINEGDEGTFQNRHYEQSETELIEVVEEVSGHVCPECGVLVSLSLNT